MRRIIDSYRQEIYHLLHRVAGPDINSPLGDAPVLLVSAQLMLTSKFDAPAQPFVMLDDESGASVRAAFGAFPGLASTDVLARSKRWATTINLPRVPPQGRMAGYLWDLLAWNEESIAEDSSALPHPPSPHPAGPYHLIQPQQVWLSEGVTIFPGVVIDASKGPVIVARGASVGANAVVQGPCYIGPGSAVQPLALVRPGMTIGPGCKVAGEIASSIIQGNTNKAHHGYLGDSYVGEWVNLAAGTTTSNLKTTYGQIPVDFGSHQIDTGRRFLGALIGDHTKTAINTRLMTGSYVGFCTMIATSALPPRFIPSFSFLTDRGIEPYQNEKAIEVMKIVFGRRDRKFTELDAEIIRHARAQAATVERR